MRADSALESWQSYESPAGHAAFQPAPSAAPLSPAPHLQTQPQSSGQPPAHLPAPSSPLHHQDILRFLSSLPSIKFMQTALAALFPHLASLWGQSTLKWACSLHHPRSLASSSPCPRPSTGQKGDIEDNLEFPALHASMELQMRPPGTEGVHTNHNTYFLGQGQSTAQFFVALNGMA